MNKKVMEQENPYEEIGKELIALERQGKLPEGFDLEAACEDEAFVQLLSEMEPYGAVRVYAAEQAAKAAKEAAREELTQEAMHRSRLPKSTRGEQALSPQEDYAHMSPEAFRALENRLRNHA